MRWAAVLLALAGCGRKAIEGGTTCQGGFLPGDLAISEVMANPDGDDAGREWFEVYNAGSEAADLTGLALAASAPDGTGEKKLVLLSGTVAAGAYTVFAATTLDLLPDYADYGYGTSLGSFRNDSGRLALRCGATIVDEVVYSMAADGASRQVGGIPDAVANDEVERWCDGQGEYDGANRGTPGAANRECGGGGGPTMCDDGGTMRPIVFPSEGEIAITEVMPDPSKVTDAVGEWFEVTLSADVDLNGLEIGTTAGTPKVTIGGAPCRRRPAGSRLLFARADADNGGLPAVEGTFDFGLSNDGGSLFVGVNGEPLDEVSWTAGPAGASLQLDSGTWCPGTTVYGSGDKGTPGAENGTCSVVVPAGMCRDGGTLRAIRTPAVGDLLIDEILPDPEGTEAEKEWFEVRVVHDVDLNGLEMGTTLGAVQQTLAGDDCLAATAGQYLTFLHNDGSNEEDPDGGLPRVDVRIELSLVNDNRGIFIGVAGEVLDSVTYGNLSEGKSRVLSSAVVDPAMNDDALDASWCLSTVAYDGINLGTPGAADPSCP